MTRVGVVGTGFGARVVAPAFAATDGCEVSDVVSARDEAAVHALCGRPDVDLVSIHSPPFLHAAHVRAALAQGKAVLCDKPFALNAAEAAALAAEANDAGVVALCNFEFRFSEPRRVLRGLVAGGNLGPVEHISWTHLSSGSRVPLRPWGWLFDRDLGGGWIGAWASHAVDTLRWMFGEIIEVQSGPRTDVSERPDAHGAFHRCTAEDGLSASLVVADDITVAIDSSFAAPVTIAPRITVIGADAVAELVADERLVVRHRDGERTERDLSVTGDHHVGPMRAFAAVVRDAVTNGIVPAEVPTFADGAACDAVLELLRARTV
jgi:predicted dehydrogenase